MFSMALLKGCINNYNHFKTMIILRVAIFFMVLHPGLALNSNFMSRNCICPQDVNNTFSLIYECTTVGPISTTWRGTAFNCPGMGNEILLRHSQFSAPGGTRFSCSNGNIMGMSVRVENNQFTSLLNVTYNPALSGTTIMCVHNNGTSDAVIGGSTIPGALSGPLPSPASISLSNIAHGPSLLLTFKWSGMVPGCQESYTIVSTCGQCPSSTQNTEIFCGNVEVPSTAGGKVCTFGVRTDVCGNIQGTLDNIISVNLRFPDPPTVSVVPTYFQETGQLAGIKAEFMESAAFNITENMDGSATLYVIEYFETSTNTRCASQTVEPSDSCVDRLCTHFFDISSSRCDRSSPISVTVSAENRLGRGPPSTPILIREVTNNFVSVTIDLMSAAVICNFQQSSTGGSTIKTCSIAYNQSETCEVDDTLRLSQVRQIAQDTPDSVIIGLPFVNRLHGDRQSYCFVVNATNGTYTAMIRGTFNTGCDPNRLYDVPTVSSPEGATCDPPLSSVGTGDGYACYSGTLVGAYAVHRCLDCDYRSVRVCMADGNWNGTALQCNCPITAQLVEISLPISLGVFVPIIVILIALLILLIVLYIPAVCKKKETSARIAQLQSRVMELSSVYEELDPRASVLLHDSNNSMEKMMDNKAYSVPRKATQKIVDSEATLGEAYEIMRSVSHQ